MFGTRMIHHQPGSQKDEPRVGSSPLQHQTMKHLPFRQAAWRGAQDEKAEVHGPKPAHSHAWDKHVEGVLWGASWVLYNLVMIFGDSVGPYFATSYQTERCRIARCFAPRPSDWSCSSARWNGHDGHVSHHCHSSCSFKNWSVDKGLGHVWTIVQPPFAMNKALMTQLFCIKPLVAI